MLQGFDWIAGLILSIRRGTADVIRVEITFRPHCAIRKCWAACKECTAPRTHSQTVQKQYRNVTPIYNKLHIVHANTPEQYPTSSRPNYFARLYHRQDRTQQHNKSFHQPGVNKTNMFLALVGEILPVQQDVTLRKCAIK